MKGLLTLLMGVGLTLGIAGCDDTDTAGGGAGGAGGIIGAGGEGGLGEGGAGEGGQGGEGPGGTGGDGGTGGGVGGEGGDGGEGPGGEGPGGAGDDGEGGDGGEGPGGAGGDGEGGDGGEGPGGAGGDGEGGMGGEGGGVMDCDQPDPATCDAAGCVWTRTGCLPAEEAHPCYALNEFVCQSRAECVWNGQWCAPDPAELPCDALEIAECANRDGECAWTGERCVDRPEGACAELNEEQCAARRDCAARYEEVPCECGCPPDAPECDCACDAVFEACEPRILDCRAVPLEACAQTPGCVIEAIGDARFCLPTDPNGCADRALGVCEADGRCQLESVEICDGGEAIPPRPAPPPDELIPPPCREELRCRPADAVICDGLDPMLCAAQPGCQLEEREICDCGEPVEPVEPGEPVQPRIAPPCPCEIEQSCVQIPACEAIDTVNACREANGCGWGVAQPDNPECQACPVCPPGAECLIIAPPQCPQECYGCLPQMPEVACADRLDLESCQADRDCEWQAQPEVCACVIDENGREICHCDDGLGACVERVRACAELDAPACGARADCVFGTHVECPPCEGGLECPCLAEFPERCMTAEDYCDGMNADICGRDPNCGLVERCEEGREGGRCEQLCVPQVGEPVDPPREAQPERER